MRGALTPRMWGWPVAVVALPGRIPDAVSRVLLLVLTTALLLTGFSGRAGVQVLDRDHAALLFPLHLHGVPGERAYVERHGAPAPFVAGHCHAPYEHGQPPPSPDEVQSASALAGSVLCIAADLTPVTPPAVGLALSAHVLPSGAAPSAPLVPPPRA